MIKVHFSIGKVLFWILKENLASIWTRNIRGIRLDSMDNVADMENNAIDWFASEDDEAKAAEIAVFLTARKRDGGRLHFTVTAD